MSFLVIAAIMIINNYYEGVNDSIDPRVAEARELYEDYNHYAQNGSYDSVFILMDTIEAIYTSVPHYKNAFETGVLYNNRAAAWLTMALHTEPYKSHKAMADSLVRNAESAVKKSIGIYEDWLQRFEGLDEGAVEGNIREEFMVGLENSAAEMKEEYLQKRKEEILESVNETPRRLSVAYTNLGIISRYTGNYEEAARYYEKAIGLWDENMTARNNLNVLLGRPMEKRSIIKKLFPPDKK